MLPVSVFSRENSFRLDCVNYHKTGRNEGIRKCNHAPVQRPEAPVSQNAGSVGKSSHANLHPCHVFYRKHGPNVSEDSDRDDLSFDGVGSRMNHDVIATTLHILVLKGHQHGNILPSRDVIDLFHFDIKQTKISQE